MADTRWLGRAVAVKQISTLVIGGGWVAADTITLVINGRDLTLTVGTTVTTTQIASDIKVMWEGETLNGDESRNAIGTDLAEYAEITAAVTASTITFTHDTAGTPFTLATSRVTANTGTVVDATPQAATGPNDVNNINNWSEGSVPALADTVFIDNTDISLLYNLGQLAGNTLTSLTVGSTFTGEIGLPKNNPNGYTEYRPTYLVIDCTTILIGKQEGTGSQRIKIDSGSVQTTLIIDRSSSSLEVGFGAVIWKGTHASNVVQINNGSLSVAPLGSEVATILTLTVSGPANVECGVDVTLGTANKGGGGNLIVHGSATTIKEDAGVVTVKGTGTVGTFSVEGGVCNYLSTGTITTMNTGGFDSTATINFNQDIRLRTVTTLNLNRLTVWNDPAQSVTIGTLNLGSDVSAIRST